MLTVTQMPKTMMSTDTEIPEKHPRGDSVLHATLSKEREGLTEELWRNGLQPSVLVHTPPPAKLPATLPSEGVLCSHLLSGGRGQ